RSTPDELDRQPRRRRLDLRRLAHLADQDLARRDGEAVHRRRFGRGLPHGTLPAMLNKLFGTKMKVVSGYKGGNDIYLAMERGEVEGRCGGLLSSISSTRPNWFPEKKVAIPFQIGLERNPQLPHVPAVGEFAKDN